MPGEVRAEIERLWRAGDPALIEILGQATPPGAGAAPRSAEDRARDLEHKMERYRQAHEIARNWLRRLGEETGGDVGRLLVELLRTVAFCQLAELQELPGDGAAAPGLAVLARAIREMESTSRSIEEREFKLREKLKVEIDRKVDALGPQAAGADGDAATLAKARELVRGLL